MKKIIFLILLVFGTSTLFAQKATPVKGISLDFFSTAFAGYTTVEDFYQYGNTEPLDINGITVGIDGFARLFDIALVGAKMEATLFMPEEGTDWQVFSLSPAIGIHYGDYSSFQFFFYATSGPGLAIDEEREVVTSNLGFHLGLGVGKVMLEYAKKTTGGIPHHNFTLRLRIGNS